MKSEIWQSGLILTVPVIYFMAVSLYKAVYVGRGFHAKFYFEAIRLV